MKPRNFVPLLLLMGLTLTGCGAQQEAASEPAAIAADTPVRDSEPATPDSSDTSDFTKDYTLICDSEVEQMQEVNDKIKSILEEDTFSAEELAAMEEADAAIIRLRDTDEWEQADEAGRKALAEALLYELADRGLVIRESIYVPEDNDVVTFTYTGGAGGGIKVMPFDPMLN